jgi:hypothetical protein
MRVQLLCEFGCLFEKEWNTFQTLLVAETFYLSHYVSL